MMPRRWYWSSRDKADQLASASRAHSSMMRSRTVSNGSCRCENASSQSRTGSPVESWGPASCGPVALMRSGQYAPVFPVEVRDVDGGRGGSCSGAAPESEAHTRQAGEIALRPHVREPRKCEQFTHGLALGRAVLEHQRGAGFEMPARAADDGRDVLEPVGARDQGVPRLERETVVAEKVDAMVQLGMANSRMKDFFDIAWLADRFSFDGALLARAIRTTFERRRTAFPRGVPVALTSAFADDSMKRTQWGAFVGKVGAARSADLPTAIARVAAFGSKPLEVAATGAIWQGRWSGGGPWSSDP